MAKFTFNMPDVGEGVAEAEIVEWHVKVGDTVSEDQHLVDVMTDKATIDIESPVDGKVLELAGKPGDVTAVGAMLLVIEVEGEVPDEVEEANEEAAAAAEPAPAPKQTRRNPGSVAHQPNARITIRSSPACRRCRIGRCAAVKPASARHRPAHAYQACRDRPTTYRASLPGID